jgi:hypothetical protein
MPLVTSVGVTSKSITIHPLSEIVAAHVLPLGTQTTTKPPL